MHHIPIIETEESTERIEITHYNFDAPAWNWRKDNPLCTDCIKINIFVEVGFSLLVNDQCYNPIYGDVCVLPPGKLHYAHMTKPARTDYFQLDIGRTAFAHVSGGTAWLDEMLVNCGEERNFLRPGEEDVKNLMKLCYDLESALIQSHKPLAYAYVIEIVELIRQISKKDKWLTSSVLSKTTTSIMNYIAAHYGENMKINDLSAIHGVSNAYLSQLFKKEVGVGIHAYLMEYRMIQAVNLLKTHSVAEVCYMCGFCDSSHFIATFKKRFDCTPMVYKRKL